MRESCLKGPDGADLPEGPGINGQNKDTEILGKTNEEIGGEGLAAGLDDEDPE